ncbi:MAG TPA: flagellar motor switch protein FliM [Terriglobia bacterium]|nr:flagellar motor switch protein FliM [Terriglobia bacterium]
MEKTLTQDEINALLRSAQAAGAKEEGAAATRKFAPFVFGKASRISKQQVKDVAQLHETFCYRMKNRLSAYLQVAMEINLMSVDEVPYSEYIESIPQQAYLASLAVQPVEAIALLSIDLPIAFAMIDLMLGGNGKIEPPQRHTTEIEEQVLQTVVDMICDELQTDWRQAADVHFRFDQTQRAAELFRLLSPYEKMLFLSFEIRVPDAFSTLTLAFPAVVSSLLLRRLAKKNTRNQGSIPPPKTQILEQILCSIFGIEMLLPPTRIRGKDLLALNPGQTILIQHRVKQPAQIHVAGSKMFTGYPVRNGKQRGGMIQQRFPVPYPVERVNE